MFKSLFQIKTEVSVSQSPRACIWRPAGLVDWARWLIFARPGRDPVPQQRLLSPYEPVQRVVVNGDGDMR